MEEVAIEARKLGLNWRASRIGAIEDGRFKPTLDTLAVLAIALGRARNPGMPGVTVTMEQLVHSESPIVLTDEFTVTSDDLLKWASGQRALPTPDGAPPASFTETFGDMNLPPLAGHNPGSPSWKLTAAAIGSGPYSTSEERLAKRAEIHPAELRLWATHLWGCDLETHRDAIAGDDATPQKKGRVSRDLLNEITAAMKQQADGDD